MANSNSILVLGAGELGLSILSSIASQSPLTSLAVLLRPSTASSTSPANAQKLSHLRSLHVSILPCDITTATEAELSTLFSPFHTIIAANGASSSSSVLKIVRAVLAAEVPRFFPWQFGVDYDIVGLGSPQPIWDNQFRTRELLRKQEITDWVIISTGLFMDMLLLREFGIVDLEARNGKGVVRALGSWETKVTVTAAADIGNLVAAIVFANPEIKNEVVYVAGETITYGTLAEVVDNVVGRKVEREVWSREFLEEELKQTPEDDLVRYRAAFAQGKGVAWDMERTWNAKNGIKTLGIEEFAKKKWLGSS